MSTIVLISSNQITAEKTSKKSKLGQVWSLVASKVKKALKKKRSLNIIQSPYFQDKYMYGSMENFFISYTKTAYNNPRSYTTIHGRYGLFILRRNYNFTYCLWNPAIHKLLKLPNPKHRSLAIRLSYISPTRSFKLINFYQDGDSEGCAVFVPGYSKTWRNLASFPLITQVNAGKGTKRISVLAAGEYVHCIRILEVDNKFYGDIVSTDMRTESFTVTALPVFCDQKKPRALDWNGKLGFWRIIEQNLEVMVFEDCKKHKWGEKQTIELPFMKNEYYRMSVLTPMFAMNSNIWFWLDNKSLFTYDIHTGKIIWSSSMQPEPDEIVNTHNMCSPSMVSFEGMHTDKELRRLRPTSLE